MRTLKNLSVACAVAMLVAPIASSPAHRASAESASFQAAGDNTLYHYDPGKFKPLDQDPKRQTWIKSNGQGDFFSAGRTYSKNHIQRGLIWFDLDPAVVPAGMRVASASLQLYVVDSPKKDHTPRDFWLVALPALPREWDEGASSADAGVSGAGSGDDPELGDATWFHTQYDPDNLAHYNPGNLPNSPWTYQPTEAGFWPEQSVVSPAGRLELGPGALGDNPFTLPSYYLPAGIGVGPMGSTTIWSAPQMAADVQRWLDDPLSNFGWIVLGDESVENYIDPNTGQLVEQSSKRGFASCDHDNEAFRPVLTVVFAAIPEPSTGVLCLIAAVVLSAYGRLRCRRAARGL